MAIVPDLTGRCAECDAAGGHHYSDCSVAIAAEREEHRRSRAVFEAVTGVGCQCGLCTADL
ncbi:hypothetical protein PBI_LEMURIA_57 [Mycobacterium phage Lemuria]|uniref:Uncharacterized protein n=1 Tax=Mycobacterium phage Lemuria TaxID=2599868 RepID=A0A5J6TJK4_9CAUD|nr:hypothetical protein KDW76_gp57 [Mycobacterium phage Lemuria]QFG10137.1 hypothetical protein PBI_LEMURIA_57 [Mycobacterium phage Lemuria]